MSGVIALIDHVEGLLVISKKEDIAIIACRDYRVCVPGCGRKPYLTSRRDRIISSLYFTSSFEFNIALNITGPPQMY